MKPGATQGKERHEGVEEFYYVIKGEGVAHVNSESAPIRKGDAIPIVFRDVHSFENNGREDLELLVVGVARTKFVLDTSLVH